MNKNVFIFLVISISFLSCKKETGAMINSGSETEINATNSETQSFDGIYSYDDSSASLKITISGASWTGKTLIKTGYGDSYDAENAEFQSGIVKGTDLYDDSGYAKIGFLNGTSLTTTIGGRSITLQK